MSEELEEKVVSEDTTEVVADEVKTIKCIDHADDEPVVSTKLLIEAGTHFGHMTRRWNPKMVPFIYGIKSGVHIINLEKTVKYMQTAYVAIKNIVKDGGKILFVGTKRAAADIIKDEALRSGSFYVCNRWLGGTLTNFKTISKRTKYLKELEEKELNGTFETMPKKEALALKKIKEKLSKNLEGIKEMRKLPNAIVVIDSKNEHNAIAEAKLLNIPVIALIDTNANPDEVTYCIPGNDDAGRSIRLITGLLSDAVVEAKGGETNFAYHMEASDMLSMDEAIKGSDKTEELKQIKMKSREDSFAIRNGDKKKLRKKIVKKEFVRSPRPTSSASSSDAPQAAPVAPVVENEENN